VAGKTAYDTTCIACHGADLKGMTGLGKDLTTSEFVKSQSDEQMVAFILVGRPASDPANTQGVDMPPKGGNPALTEEDILNIVAYVRSMQAP
jgi:disulfide bond formation protein DsbB